MNTQQQPTTAGTAYEDLVREYAQLDALAAPALARMDEIKKFLRDLPIGTHDIAGLKVTLAANARFDAERFAAKYPPTEFPEFYSSAVDRDKVKELLPGKAVDAFKTIGAPRVTIK